MNPSAFLDAADLRQLTGYVKPSKQIAFLKSRGIPHQVNSRGYPVVRRDMDKSPVSVPQLGPVR